MTLLKTFILNRINNLATLVLLLALPCTLKRIQTLKDRLKVIQ